MRAPVSFRWGVVVLTAVALLVVWGVYVRVCRSVLSSQTREAIAQAETIAGAFQKSTFRAVHEVDITLRSFAREYAEAGLPHAREIIDGGLFDPALIHHFAVLDSDGTMVFRSEGGGGSVNLRDESMFAFHRDTGKDLMFIGPPYPGTSGGEPLLRLSRRIDGPDGQFAGVVIANVDPDDLADFYKHTNLGPNLVVALVGFDKIVRARGAMREMKAGFAIPDSKLWDALDHSVSGVYQQKARTDGLTRAYAYTVVEGYPLIVTVGVALADVEASVAGLQGVFLVIASLLSASVVLVAGFLLVQHRAAEQLRVALNVNRDFLARVSHELRTPLNAILGFSEIIRDRMLGPNAGERYAAYAHDIHDSGRHLLALIDDIMDLSRLQAGLTDLAPAPVDAAAVIAWAARVVSSQVEAKNIALVVSVAPDAAQVTADERALKQMLLNLLSNAVKFTHAGGRIDVSVSRAAGGRCLLRVADSGIGMTPEQLSQAVVPFGQASAMTARPGQGTGLGLAIVKSLMDAHGGILRIDSRPGEGTNVTLEFAA